MPKDEQRTWLKDVLGVNDPGTDSPAARRTTAGPRASRAPRRQSGATTSTTDSPAATAPGGGTMTSGRATAPDREPAGGTGRPVPPSQVIAGASGVQTSTGELTNETAAEGADFGEGAQANAEENDHHLAGSHYRRGSNPMQSPDLSTARDFALRYGIGFLCSTYPPGFGNLADIAEYSRPNSAYLRAFQGMNQQQQYTNPTRSQVLSTMADWIRRLNHDLPPGGVGQLVVSFQGHGGRGNFYASDGRQITASELAALATRAERMRVSLRLVLDACFAGAAVPEFQDHAADSVDQQIDQNVEGAGQVCSQDNRNRANELRMQMAHARELIQFSRLIAGHGSTLSGLIRRIRDEGSEDAWNAAMAENQTIIGLIQSMQNQFHHNMAFGNDPRMRLNEIDQAFNRVLSYLGGIQPQTCFDYNDWTGAIGEFQDQISDGANRIIGILQQASRGS
jgi:hypothetical protein